MRVTCNICKFEASGTCTKKSQSGKPQAIKLTKRRVCETYSEDPMKVFTQFRRKEANRAKMRAAAVRRSTMAAAINAGGPRNG